MPNLHVSTPYLSHVPQKLACLLMVVTICNSAIARERLQLQHQPLELPGPPAAIVAADVNKDGHQDLVAVVVYTVWDQIGIEETTEMDQVEGLVEVLTIVPALLDHRELFVFLGSETGEYRSAGPALPLEPSVLSIEAGPPSAPIVALTDDGLSILEPVLPEDSRTGHQSNGRILLSCSLPILQPHQFWPEPPLSSQSRAHARPGWRLGPGPSLPSSRFLRNLLDHRPRTCRENLPRSGIYLDSPKTRHQGYVTTLWQRFGTPMGMGARKSCCPITTVIGTTSTWLSTPEKAGSQFR